MCKTNTSRASSIPWMDDIYTTIGVCPKNLSSKFDRFLAERSHLDTNHGVNFSTPISCQSATFVRPLFAFVLYFLRQKIIKKHKCGESVSIGVIDQVLSANYDPNALPQIIAMSAIQGWNVGFSPPHRSSVKAPIWECGGLRPCIISDQKQ